MTAIAPPASLELLSINTVRALAMDAVQRAESGHPGTPMALAPLVYRLYTTHMRHDPKVPDWPDRDRFVLSVGHASMVLYAALHLSGYKLPLEEIVNFRQWGSITPGHPEVKHTEGVETTTGPLGQGVANAVGMAIAEAQLAATTNVEGHTVVDHYTYFIAGDGCLMEGISHEASSLAGHLKLGKLIGFYDDNRITIDGSTDLALSDDAAKRFESYGWQVLHIADVNDLEEIDAAVAAAKADTVRPTMIITRTVIGFGSPSRAGTSKAHGEPLGAEEIIKSKDALGWVSHESFFVPDEARANWTALVAERAAARTEWQSRFEAFSTAQPAAAAEFLRRMSGELPANWDAALPTFTAENGTVASRAASGTVLNAIGASIPELIGGSADLTGSNLTLRKGDQAFSATNRGGRYMYYGVREHAMGAIMNGLTLHGGMVPYSGTFLVFSDYMRPAIRLAALMKARSIYVFTHDSIGLGEDGPTHQPIEHLTALRSIPNLLVFRPADATEVAECWRVAINHKHGPSAIALSRQKLRFLNIPAATARAGVEKGAYVLADSPTPAKIVLMATGSEVGLAMDVQKSLAESGIAARVVSVPSMELFRASDAAYRASVLPAGIPRLAIEAGHPMSWWQLIAGNGDVVGLTEFGASAPFDRLYKEFGLSIEAISARAKQLVG
ncbi:MAG TPA: transketolase [Gemmatimonadaceae bacterium]|nr:transketolase [Gemmatimonadaceae bacterium]